MPFSDRSSDDQLDQVSEALQLLLGEDPSQQDYIALCRATRTIVEALEDAIIARPLLGWKKSVLTA
jgi:hypothetical protein